MDTILRAEAEHKPSSPADADPVAPAVDATLLGILARVGGMPDATEARVTRDESGRWREVELIADEAQILEAIRQHQAEGRPPADATASREAGGG